MESSAPDTVGIGPIPDAVSAAPQEREIVLRVDRNDLSCLREELEIALAQAPASGDVEFHGVRVCGIASP